MSRTETLSIQVHPNDEQSQINLMQQFHWSVLGSQEIKTIDNRLERRGDTIYQVASSEHYVKLTFSRELDLPNLKEVKQIEQSYFATIDPPQPKLFPGGLVLWGIAALLWGIGIVAWIAYYFMSYKPKSEEWTRVTQENRAKREALLKEVSQYT